MKKILLLLTVSLVATGVAAQNPTAYFMEGSTFRMQFNPAFAPHRGYFNIPVLGGIDLSVGGNLALGDLFFPRNGKLVTLLDASVSSADALAGLRTKNGLNVDSRINILGFGAYTRYRKHFWSFELNMRTAEDTDLPYSLFEFLKTGRSGRISNIGVSASAYLEAAFSYSFPLLCERLYIGVRGKFLAGAARARLNYDRFDVSLEEDRWNIDARGTIDFTAGGADISAEEPYFKIGDLDMKPTKPAGYGFAVDLGATYDILPDLQASLAVTDLGFMSWSKKNTVSGVSDKSLEFTGTTIPDDGTPQPDFDLDVLEFERVGAGSGAHMLRTAINAGLEYKLWRRRIGIGLLYSARFRTGHTLHDLTGSVNFQPIDWFTVTGSYSVLAGRGGAFGIGLNLCPSWINFFVATDLLTARRTPQWVPIRQSSVHVTFGLGVPVGRYGQRATKRYIYPPAML